jgi:hypothetical protein
LAVRVFLTILALIVRMLLAPLLLAVAAGVVVDHVVGSMPAMVIGSTLLLTIRLAAHPLTAAVWGRLKKLIAMGTSNTGRRHLLRFTVCSGTL